MARYSNDFIDAIIDKLKSPETKSIRALANEHDLPIATVLNWIRKKGITINMQEECLTETVNISENSLEEKFKVILETSSMSDEEIGAYCRRRGLYQEMLDNLDSRNKKILAKENNDLKIKLRELKAELRCKEKALAESAALLLLKKKAEIIWQEIEEEK
jgi:transposase